MNDTDEDLDEFWLYDPFKIFCGSDFAEQESATFVIEFNPETATWISKELTPEERLSKSIKDEYD